jgi:hypothetical protein
MILKEFQKVNYSDLPAKAQEAYNYQKASAILAEYGFVTNLLKYDWNGADFIAQHIDGKWLKIQIKGRLTTKLEYEGKDIYIMFEDKENSNWYLYPHDELVIHCRVHHPGKTFTDKGHSRGKLSKWVKEWLSDYLIT